MRPAVAVAPAGLELAVVRSRIGGLAGVFGEGGAGLDAVGGGALVLASAFLLEQPAADPAGGEQGLGGGVG